MAEIGSAVAGQVVDSLFVLVKKEIGYMWNCSENVQKFRHEARKLEDMKGRVQELINTAIGKGDKLSHGVEDWVKEAGTEISKADEFLQQEANAKKTCCCKIGLCGNWGTLHRYGKSAIEMAPSLVQLQERGNAYESCVSVETRAPGPLDVYQNKDLDDLHTHKSALKDIIAGLEDESKQIIGIYGLGGVGKTTLAKEVAARVKNTLFADVAFTTVSQNVDVEKIKKDIGEATKRIMKGDKILIILDDVWETLDLQELCIPFGNNHKNCKILLSSRYESVCDNMNAQSKICVNSLPIEEAWILFKHVVGQKVETDASLKPVAKEVAEECGGLPLLIKAVGNALKHKNIDIWNSALSQLKKHAPSEINPDIRKAFTRLKLSYDYLESKEAKSCFLLCAMFPEDGDIWLEVLVHYVVGLRKFDDIDSMKDARDRVQNAFSILASSGLLLNSERKGCMKMHDVVRDVALLIASQAGNNKFLVKAGQGLIEWLPRDTSLESYTGISLQNNNITKLPDYEVHLPHLQFFIICANRVSMISDEFIGCMKEIKVLDISWNKISSLPQSFRLLTKLHTLDLRGNKPLHEISILGELKELEILILKKTGITEIPKEIAQLVNIRVLEVSDCEYLSRITQGVISALSRLEELCIEFKWDFNGTSDCIAEIMSLSELTYLDLTVASIDDIPAQGFNSEKLERFVIQIGKYDRSDDPGHFFTSRSGRSCLVHSIEELGVPLLGWLKKLIEGSRPITILNGIENLDNIMPTFYHQGFNKLEHIQLSWCHNVSCLVDDSTSSDWNEGNTKEKFFMELKHLQLRHLDKLEVLWKCPDAYVSVTNLVKLEIYYCDKLERVFSVSIAQGLINLKELSISGCNGLEEVIWGGENESRNVIMFPSLKNISFKVLESLKSFFNSGGNENCSIIYPSLVDVKIHYCRGMKKWGPGIHETPSLKTLAVDDDVQVLDGPFAMNEAVAKAWKKREEQHDEEEEEDKDE